MVTRVGVGFHRGNPPPTHVYLTWVSIYLYDTFLYHPKGQGYHTLMTPGDLVCRPPESNLVHGKVKNIYDLLKYPGVGGGEGFDFKPMGHKLLNIFLSHAEMSNFRYTASVLPQNRFSICLSYLNDCLHGEIDINTCLQFVTSDTSRRSANKGTLFY